MFHSRSRIAVFLIIGTLFNVVSCTNTILQRNIAEFLEAAEVSANSSSLTDKVTAHKYQVVYGMHLLPAIQSHKHDMHETKEKRKFKLLEIGMGCDMVNYSPGRSLLLWKYLLGQMGDIWMAEYDAKCVKDFIAKGYMDGFRIVTGDQSDPKDLKRWVQETGGDFDVIIDDGSHKNQHIKASFDVLFKDALRPGGLYFIEDLALSTNKVWMVPGFKFTTSIIIQAWSEQLMIPWRGKNAAGPLTELTQKVLAEYPMPETLMSISCTFEACVLMKSF